MHLSHGHAARVALSRHYHARLSFLKQTGISMHAKPGNGSHGFRGWLKCCSRYPRPVRAPKQRSLDNGPIVMESLSLEGLSTVRFPNASSPPFRNLS
ncbi:hypothetical protein VTK73DRAFT_2286 [Phialemonium thermophilum]|uniref:Uncharacterized protein n=1 Tax=Phialemonium thermophilum TaxID=223376 RepID=A0ABR3X523_9PEZI